MHTIGVAVIGVGYMGAIHARAYAAEPRAHLAGVFDARADTARSVAAEVGAAAFASLDELLDRPEVEAVSICTPDADHVEPTLAALAAGKHVLLEKPIATTLADADRIVAAAATAAGQLMVAQIVRFDPRYVRVKRMLDDGALGDPISLHARRITSSASQDNLRGRVSVQLFLGIHDYDTIRWLTGREFVHVHTEARSGLLAAKGYAVEDVAFTVGRLEGGAVACVESGWVLPPEIPRGGDIKLEVIGTGGTARVDLVEQGLAVCLTGERYERPSFGHAIGEEIADFLDGIAAGRQPSVTAADGRASLQVALAAIRSSELGAPVRPAMMRR
jgi:predicted dehydrogenase